jgi:hypothetical protein
MRRDRLATWLGHVGCAGLQNLFAPRLLSDALPIAADAIDWLRNERRGVLIINPNRAKWELAGAGRLLVGTLQQGRALQAALSHLPEIVLPASIESLAA